MSKYQFIVGVSLVDLETQLNNKASAEPDLNFKQMLFVPGTGFVAVVELSGLAELPATASVKPVKKSTRRVRITE